LFDSAQQVLHQSQQQLALRGQLLEAFNPTAALQRGYALVRVGETIVRSGAQLQATQQVAIELADATIAATTTHITMKKENYHAQK
jgi:exonuclease VII large subunit